jgi:outer membrane protein assembly factor BamB
VLRAYDGAAVPAPDFANLFKERIRLVGRNLLTSYESKDGVTLRLYDPLTGRDDWKQTFAANSTVLQAEDCNVAGVVEPTGLVRVVDLDTRKEVLNASSKMDETALAGIKKGAEGGSAHVLYDGKYVYVAVNAPLAAQTQVLSNVAPVTGLRALNVNGDFYAFRTDTGKMHWKTVAANTQLVLDHFAEMPIVLFTGQVGKTQQWGGLIGQPTANVYLFEKRTGKSLYDAEKTAWNGGPFTALEIDARGAKIELQAARAKIAVSLKSDAPKPKPEAKIDAP